MTAPAQTIAELSTFGTLGLRDRVVRVFRDRESAHKYLNTADSNRRVRVLAGKFKPGDAVPAGTPSERFR